MFFLKHFAKKLILFLVVFVSLLLISANLQAELKFPEPQGYINDFAGMLSQTTENELNEILQNYEQQTTNEIAVVTVLNLQGITIEDYAVRLFEEWKIGKKGKDNGILLLIAKEERKIRIEVGYGLEPTLTDAQAYRIIQEIISPSFKGGDFDTGVKEGVNGIIKVLSGEELPETVPNAEERDEDGWPNPAAFFIFSLGILSLWISAVLARSKSWWAGGVIGAVAGLAGLYFLGLLIGILLIFIFVPLGLAFDYLVSTNYQARNKEGQKPSWWAGGNWRPTGGSGGSGGFGGFGGGSSGGGGASGGW